MNRGFRRTTRRLRRSSRPALVVALSLALTATAGVTPALASPQQIAEQRAQRILDEVRDAAEKSTPAPTATENAEPTEASSTPTERAEVPAESQVPSSELTDNPVEPGEPVAEGTIVPGEGVTIEAADLGATVEFSGFKIDEDLAVTLAPVISQDDVEAVNTLTAETEAQIDGTVLGTPIEVTAVTNGGVEITEFPADAEISKATKTAPARVTELDPGVALQFVLSDEDLADFDAADITVYTRETNADEWTKIPSYLDSVTGIVHGEIDHLSQFVVIGTKNEPDPGPVVVLDPDDNLGHTTGPGGAMDELPQNLKLARGLKSMLEDRCNAVVTLTRDDAAQDTVSHDLRAGIAAAQDPDLTATLAFNAYEGNPWGVEGDGGTNVYTRGGYLDGEVTSSLNNELPSYTTRPSSTQVDPRYPNAAFASLPGAVTHLETLFIDHNFDRPVIDNGFDAIVDGTFTGLGKYLETQGFDCTDPEDGGGWPKPPSDAEKAKWRNLGYQNFLMYGADPVSFSTGNLIEDEPIFSLTGLGSQVTDLTLVYNSQDGRESRVGAGWSFGLGARAQRFDDNSVMVVRGDGASFVFESDGDGGYDGENGLYQTLTEGENGRLILTADDGESWVFNAGDDEGIGELAKHTDRQGNSTTLRYADPDDNDKFVPLESITDEAGQRIEVGHDGRGRISSFTYPDGRKWTLDYDSAGDLRSITAPDGRDRTFRYDDDHLLLRATDEAGVTYLVNEYDGQGRVVKQWDAEDNLRTFSYNTGEGRTTYTDNEGSQTIFYWDDKHRITGTRNAAGQETAYTYDGRNQVRSYTDEAGHVWKYGYDDGGNVDTQTLPDGSVIRYEYTAKGDLTKVTDSGGVDGAERSTQFEVDPLGLVTGTIAADGTTTGNTYNSKGDLTSTTSASGAVTTFEYDGRGNVIAVTDPLGAVTGYVYDTANRVIEVLDAAGGVTRLAWDDGDRLVSSTDAEGATTEYGYDKNDHLTRVTDANGDVTKYSWDDLFRLTAVVAADGGVTRYEYNTEDELTGTTDPEGAVTEFELDDLYRAVTVTDPNGGEWKRSYDAVGNITELTDPEGAATVFEYDALSRLTSQTGPTGISQATSYDSVGRVTSTTDAAGGSIGYQYDLLDRVTAVTDQAGETSGYGYDVDGNLISAIDRKGAQWQYAYDASSRLVGVIDPLSGATKYEYDVLGNLIASTDQLDRTSTLSYDKVSRLIGATDPQGGASSYAYDPVGRLTGSTDPNGNTTTTAYSPTGQVEKIIDALEGETSFSYDKAGRQIGMLDPDGNATQYGYDAAGQLTQVVEGLTDGEDAPDANVTSSYSWTATGNLASTTDPNGNTTAYTYDAAGLLSSETNALGGTWSYQYDNLGRVTKQIDANSASTGYSYTARSEVATVQSPGQKVTFEYDANGQLIAMTDPQGVTGWKYDALGNLSEQIDPNDSRLGYSYDAASQLKTLTMPTGDQIGYKYDKASRPIEQTSPWGDIAYEWDPAGNLTDLTRSTGVVTQYQYDALNRATQVRHFTPAGPGDKPEPTPSTVPSEPAAPEVKHLGKNTECVNAAGYLADRKVAETAGQDCVKSSEYLKDRTLPTAPNPVADGDAITFDYDFDPAGNVTQATRTIGGLTADGASAADSQVESRDYAYDRLNRLVSSASSTGAAATYAYDKAGNKVGAQLSDKSGTTKITAVFNEVNQLTSSTSQVSGQGAAGESSSTYSYDGNGNRTSQTEAGAKTDYGFNAQNQVTSVTTKERSSSFTYDGLGRQLEAEDTTSLGSTGTTSVWSGSQIVQQSNTVSGITTLVRDAQGDLAVQGRDDASKWALLDGLSSTAALAVGGSVTQLSNYSDWGVQGFESSGWDAAVNFTGETTDAGYGLNSYLSRTYDPTTGTWLSQDSWRGLLTEPQTVARYAYVLNNPISMVDSLGYEPHPGMEGGYNSAAAVKKRQAIAENTQHYGGGIYSSTGYPSYATPSTKVINPGLDQLPTVSTSFSAPAVQSPSANIDAVTDRHADPTLDQISLLLGTAGAFLGWIPGLKLVGVLLGGISTAITCISNGFTIDCLWSAIGTALGTGSVLATKNLVAEILSPATVKVLQDTLNTWGIMIDVVGLLRGWGLELGMIDS